MIDEKMLAKDEADLRIFAAELKDDAMTEQAEIIRLARRYLALRDEAKTQRGSPNEEI